jgi:hypothetical protein
VVPALASLCVPIGEPISDIVMRVVLQRTSFSLAACEESRQVAPSNGPVLLLVPVETDSSVGDPMLQENTSGD